MLQFNEEEMLVHYTHHDMNLAAFKHKTGDAGYDLHCTQDTWIWPFRVTKVPANCSVEIPENYFGRITGRSGMTLSGNLALPGTIDSIYRGQLAVMMTRIGFLPKKMKRGDRIAQLIVMPYAEVTWEHKRGLSSTTRGTKGFGDSGIN